MKTKIYPHASEPILKTNQKGKEICAIIYDNNDATRIEIF